MAAQVATVFEQLNPDLVVGSAAGGADLIILEEAARRSVPSHIALPLPIDEFREVSVLDQGQPWIERFDRLVAARHNDGDRAVSVVDCSSYPDWPYRGNDLVLQTASGLSSPRSITALVIADLTSPSVSSDFANKAEGLNWPVVNIVPLALNGARPHLLGFLN